MHKFLMKPKFVVNMPQVIDVITLSSLDHPPVSVPQVTVPEKKVVPTPIKPQTTRTDDGKGDSVRPQR